MVKERRGRMFRTDIGMWIAVILISALLALAVVFYRKSLIIGSDPTHYTTICIEGHAYQLINFGTKIALANKLDEEGMPTKCVD